MPPAIMKEPDMSAIFLYFLIIMCCAMEAKCRAKNEATAVSTIERATKR
jgi:hypothetical protein